ncbi:MAG: metalloregulator ArsR/SmtB family transcription factor [Pseudomonadota bacterium]
MTNYQGASAASPNPLDGMFHALSDPTRRAVVQALSAGPATVSSLAEPFDMKLPTFLQHVRVLERSGIVLTTKTGRTRTCELNAATLTIAERWIRDQRALWEGRFDRLETLLAEAPDDAAPSEPETPR